jgi:hypothetical protein
VSSLSYTPNLKLRVDANLTANAKFNLARLDDLAGVYLVDSTDEVVLRGKQGITLRPLDASIGGSGSGAGEVTLDGTLRLLDQATGGGQYLTLQYKSDTNGSADAASDRTLSVDLDGANRSLTLGGNLRTDGGDLVLGLSGATNVTLPTTGTLATLAGAETLTNKTISAADNTISGLTAANLSASAGVAYSQLTLTGGVVDADVSAGAAIQYSKLALTGSIRSTDIEDSAGIPYSKLLLSGSILGADISPSAAIPYSKLSLAGSLVDADVSADAALDGAKVSPAFGAQRVSTETGFRLYNGANYLNVDANPAMGVDWTLRLPGADGTSGQLLQTDGSGNLSWATVAGTGTVTSVDVTAPAGLLTATGGPVVVSGTVALDLVDQGANQVFAGPTTGADGAPAFRGLVKADLPALTSDDLSEGSTNLFYTAERVDDRVAALVQNGVGLTWSYNDGANTLTGNVSMSAFSTSDLTEGTNLYYTTARFDTRLATKSTSDIAEGSNLYYTTARFDTRLAAKTTADLAEGSNLYWTTARGQAVVDAYTYRTTWTSGTTKTVTHSLGTRHVRVDLYDLDSYESVWVDTVTRTDSNTVDLTTSAAPSGSGWEVLITKV